MMAIPMSGRETEDGGRENRIVGSSGRWGKCPVDSNLRRKRPVQVKIKNNSNDRPRASGYKVSQNQTKEERQRVPVGLHAAVAEDKDLTDPCHDEVCPEELHGETGVE